MRKTMRTGAWGLLFFLGTGCVTIIHEAIERDLNENARGQSTEVKSAQLHEDPSRICPDDKVQVKDCRVTPCKVTCEDPKEPKR